MGKCPIGAIKVRKEKYIICKQYSYVKQFKDTKQINIPVAAKNVKYLWVRQSLPSEFNRLQLVFARHNVYKDHTSIENTETYNI